jgi:hypothetical protein
MVTVIAAVVLMTAVSLLPGAVPVLQLDPTSQSPLPELIQVTVAGTVRSSSDSNRNLEADCFLEVHLRNNFRQRRVENIGDLGLVLKDCSRITDEV